MKILSLLLLLHLSPEIQDKDMVENIDDREKRAQEFLKKIDSIKYRQGKCIFYDETNQLKVYAYGRLPNPRNDKERMIEFYKKVSFREGGRDFEYKGTFRKGYVKFDDIEKVVFKPEKENFFDLYFYLSDGTEDNFGIVTAKCAKKIRSYRQIESRL